MPGSHISFSSSNDLVGFMIGGTEPLPLSGVGRSVSSSDSSSSFSCSS